MPRGAAGEEEIGYVRAGNEEHEADRTIVNVEGSTLAAGNTSLDVLRRSPGVTVDGSGTSAAAPGTIYYKKASDTIDDAVFKPQYEEHADPDVQFFLGQDGDGRTIGVALFQQVDTPHGPIEVGLTFGPDGATIARPARTIALEEILTRSGKRARTSQRRSAS